MILQAYIDDSADETVFVLAGFVAPADEWAKFSDAWAAALAAQPKIWSLKTTDAMRLQGQFFRWKPEDRDAKLSALYRVIDDHVSFEVSAVVPLAPLSRVFDGAALPKRSRDPYYIAFTSLIGDLAKAQIAQGMPEKVDFVFDEQVMHQTHILAAWAAVVRDAPPEIKPMLGSTPIFRSDSDVLPLQAADLEAWWLRRRYREKILGVDRLEYPWAPSNMPGVGSIHTEETLIELRDRLLQTFASLGYDHASGTVLADAQAALRIKEATEND